MNPSFTQLLLEEAPTGLELSQFPVERLPLSEELGIHQPTTTLPTPFIQRQSSEAQGHLDLCSLRDCVGLDQPQNRPGLDRLADPTEAGVDLLAFRDVILDRSYLKDVPQALNGSPTAHCHLQDQAIGVGFLTRRKHPVALVDFIPNTVQEYKRLGDIVNDARMAGLMDWSAIEDRTRELNEQAHWNSPSSILEACASQFRTDRWANQDVYLEVWVEKEALAGVFERACKPLDVPLFCCRDYTSQSEMWGAGQRFVRKMRAGKKVVILHFGDHDPSGIDMTRDINDRLHMFTGHHILPKLEVRRLALNMDQVEEFNPPRRTPPRPRTAGSPATRPCSGTSPGSWMP